MESIEKVYLAMSRAENPYKIADIAEMAGIERKEAEKAIKKLAAEGKVFSPARKLS